MRNSTLGLALGYVVVAVIIIGLFTAGILGVSSVTHSSETTATASTYVILKAQTLQFSIGGSNQLLAFPFNLTSTSTVQGAFTSTHGGEMYIDPYEGWLKNFSSYYSYSSGSVVSANFYLTLPPDMYFLVFLNPSYGVSSNITITQSITASSI